MMNLVHLTELKAQLDALRPFPPALLDNLEKWFEVELTYSSNAIEGNTLTRQETALVIEKGITVGGKPLKDHLEAINHRDALHKMKELARQSSFSCEDILSLHLLVLKGLDDAGAGRLRAIPVRISGSLVVLPNPMKVPELMNEFEQWMKTTQDHPALFAAMAHYRLVTIHPFVDGNGRTARLLMNLILIQHGYPPAIIPPQDRLKYLKGLEKAQFGGSIEDYLGVIDKAIRRSFHIYLKALRGGPSGPSPQALLKIGDLAKATQETLSTLRYWTKLGLLDVSTTTPAGYQLYEEAMINRCRRIRELQQQRYTLDEITTMVLTE